MLRDRTIQDDYDRWKQSHYGKDRDVKFTTLSDEPVEPLYTPLDLETHDFSRDIGFPGAYPYTRGIYGNMHRGRLWTMRQFAGFGNARDTNERFHYLLKNGVTGLSVAFDNPTLMGIDSDDPRALGEVGRTGVAVDSLADMEELFAGIPLDRVSTSMTINAPAAILLALYVVVGEKQGVAPEQLTGTLQNDILKEYIAQKEWIYPPKGGVKLIVDTVEYTTRSVPRYNPVSISGYHIREAGATALQELAFTIADGMAYVEALARIYISEPTRLLSSSYAAFCLKKKTTRTNDRTTCFRVMSAAAGRNILIGIATR